jgi:hypothetical protein
LVVWAIASASSPIQALEFSGLETDQAQQLPILDPELRIQLGAIAPLGGQVCQ